MRIKRVPTPKLVPSSECMHALITTPKLVPSSVECMHALITTPMRVPLHMGTAGPHGGVNESLQVEVATGITG